MCVVGFLSCVSTYYFRFLLIPAVFIKICSDFSCPVVKVLFLSSFLFLFLYFSEFYRFSVNFFIQNTIKKEIILYRCFK